MAYTPGISFLGQSNAQQFRLRAQSQTLADLQRQVATQKKHETFSGFGFESLTLQKYRMDRSRTETWLGNIGAVTTRINLMTDMMGRASELGRQLMGSIQTATREGNMDVGTIKVLARDALALMRDLVNLTLEDRYLFAGSDTALRPFDNLGQLDANFQTEIADWLGGATTTAQLIANAEGFTGPQLGFNPGLSSSGSVSIRIEETTEIDYTVMADSSGFQDIMRALAFAANIELPGATDAPTNSEFHDALDAILLMAKRGVDAIDAAATSLGSKFNLIKNIEETHERDVALFDNLISKIEDADTTEVVVKLQAMQTQVTASYEVTRIVSQLSLVNFI
jgi:flagellar hook-associated protein 3 FlgL